MVCSGLFFVFPANLQNSAGDMVLPVCHTRCRPSDLPCMPSQPECVCNLSPQFLANSKMRLVWFSSAWWQDKKISHTNCSWKKSGNEQAFTCTKGQLGSGCKADTMKQTPRYQAILHAPQLPSDAWTSKNRWSLFHSSLPSQCKGAPEEIHAPFERRNRE